MGNDLNGENTLNFMEIEFFFSRCKFHGNEIKHGKRNIERGSTVTFEVKRL